MPKKETKAPDVWWKDPLLDVLAGTVGGLAGKMIEYPFDTVKVRMQSQLFDAPSRRRYTSPWDCFSKSVREEGFRGLYRGLSVPLAGTIVETATLFSANGMIKRELSGGTGNPLPMSSVLAAGGFTGFVVAHVLTPMELIKCRLQVQPGPSSSPSAVQPKYRGPLDCIVTSVREEGWRVLFRGHTGTILREIPGTACWFGAYELFLRWMTPPGKKKEDLSALTTIVAGALGGMAYWSAFYPADTVKSMIQSHQSTEVAVGGTRPSFFSTFRTVYRQVGLRGLYTGILPTLARAAPSNAAVFLLYEWSHKFMKDRWG